MSSKEVLTSLLSKTELFKGLAIEDLEACRRMHEKHRPAWGRVDLLALLRVL